MLVKLICPQCGGKMEIDDSQEKAYCTFCGAELANLTQKIDITQTVNVTGTVVTKNDRSNEPNLIIDFSCEEPNGRMVITFNNTKMKRVINNGQTASMRLPLGHCVAEMDLAGRSYKRDLWIVEDAPVRINASAFGRREIVIEQPPYKEPEPVAQANGQQAPVQQAPAAPRAKPHPFSVVGFILSLTVIAGVVGLVFGILGLIKSKNERPKTLAVLAIVFGAVFTLCLIIGISNAINNGGTTTEAIKMLL